MQVSVVWDWAAELPRRIIQGCRDNISVTITAGIPNIHMYSQGGDVLTLLEWKAETVTTTARSRDVSGREFNLIDGGTL